MERFKGHYMNISLDRIIKSGYELVGKPGLLKSDFPLQASVLSEVIDGLAKEAIDNSNSNLKYDGAAIFTKDSDEKWGDKITEQTAEEGTLHLAIVIPIRKINYQEFVLGNKINTK
jgi:hypothetical protein